MNTIRFTYHNTEVFKSTYILSFFRLAGIVVNERFFESKSIQEKLDFEPDSDVASNLFTNYDANLFIVQNEEEENFYNNGVNGPNNLVIRMHENETEYQLAERILVELKNNFIINSSEFTDLHTLLEIYDSEKVYQLIYKAKYLLLTEDDAKLLVDDYVKLSSKIIESLKTHNVKEWGSEDFKYSKFAAINTTYEITNFCFHKHIPFRIAFDNIIQICDKMLQGIPELYNNILMLKGNIYCDLFCDSNKAYEEYVNCRKLDNRYYSPNNFYKCANYYQNFAYQYENAIKFYNKGLTIFPDDYYGWFKIGFNYSKYNNEMLMKHDSENIRITAQALMAYRNVEKILHAKLAENVISPFEIEVLFKSQYYSLCAFEENISLLKEESLNSILEVAEKTIAAVETSTFFEYICKDEIEKKKLKKYIKDKLLVQGFYERLTFYYGAIYNEEKKEECKKKLLSLK